MIRNVMKKSALAAAVAASLGAGQALAAVSFLGGDSDASMSLGQTTPLALNAATLTGVANNDLAVAGNLTTIFAGKGDFNLANSAANPVTVSVTNGGTDVTASRIAGITYGSNSITVTWSTASLANDKLTVTGLDVVNADADGLGATAATPVVVQVNAANAGLADVTTATIASVSQAQGVAIASARATTGVITANGTSTEQIDVTVTAAGSAALPQAVNVALKSSADPSGAAGTDWVTSLTAADVTLAASLAGDALDNDATENEIATISWTQTGSANVTVKVLDDDTGTLIDGTTSRSATDGKLSLSVAADAATVVTVTVTLDNGQATSQQVTFEPVGSASAITTANGFFSGGVANAVVLTDANGQTVSFVNSEVTLKPVVTTNTSYTVTVAQPNVTATATGTAPEIVPSVLTYTKGGVTVSQNVDVVLGTAANAKVVAHSVAAGTGFWTGIGLSNDSATSTSTYQMIGRDAAGKYVAAAVGTIPKSGKVAVTADSVFGAKAGQVAYINLTSSNNGEAFQLFGQTKGSDGAAESNMAGINVGAAASAGTYELPHFASNTDFWTGLAIVNGGTAQTVTVSLVGEDGVAIGSKTISLAANAKSVTTLASLFGGAQGTGTLSVTTTQNASAIVLIGKQDGTTLSGLELQ